MSIGNINNWFNSFIPKNKRDTKLKDEDLIAFGRRDPRFFNNYKPVAIKFGDLKKIVGGSAGDANNQILTIEGEGDELVLSNGTLDGTPIPDSVIDMNDFTSLYDNHAPTKSGKVAPGAFTGALLKEATITFGSAFTNANYTPVVTIQSPDNYSVSVKNITASSFTICLNSVVVPTVDVYWSAIKHGEY
jgi:hypothetical protein